MIEIGDDGETTVSLEQKGSGQEAKSEVTPASEDKAGETGGTKTEMDTEKKRETEESSAPPKESTSSADTNLDKSEVIPKPKGKLRFIYRSLWILGCF